MKYKRIIFISLLLSLIGLMCLFVFAEKEVLPIITWDKTYGGSGDDWAWSLIQTTDGGYAVAGETSSKGAGDRDFWVIKLDNKGNMIWDRTYGGSNDDRAYSLIQTTDGGYAVAGSTYSKGAGDADFWVIKLDNKGNMIWDRTYGGSDFDWAYSLIQTTDGGYAVAGNTYSKGAGGVDFWVIKLDYQGNMVWDKTFGGRSNDGAGSLSLIQTTDGGYAIAGDTFSKGAGNVDFWVIKLDYQGNMFWDKTFGGRSYDWVRSLIQTTGGGYAVAGSTYSKGAGNVDFWVIKLDYQGNMFWDKTFGGRSNDGGVSLSLIQTTGGGYAIAGLTSSKGAGEEDFWVIKLDNQGNKVWDRTYGGSDEDGAHSLIQTTDGGYAVAGWTCSKGAGESDFWVIKLDVQGKPPEKIDTQNTGAINLTSTPSSAKVFLDAGQYMGKTPLTIDKVSPGKHKVTLVLADYEKYVQEVDVIAGKVVDVSAILLATRIQPMHYPWKSIIVGWSTPPQGLRVQGKLLKVIVDLGDKLSPSELEALAKGVKLIDENGREYPCFGRSFSEGARIEYLKDGEVICLFEADIAYGFMFEVGSEPSNYSLLWPDYPPFAVGNPLDTPFCSTQ